MSAEEVELELATARLRLRVGAAEEADAVAAFQRRNRAHLAPWEPTRPEAFFTSGYWRAALRNDLVAARQDGRYRWTLWPLDAPDRAVGFVHLSNVVRGAFHACHLGFGVDHARQGRGLMTEALQAALTFAFGALRLHRVEANYRPENVRSARLLARLGFVPQGYARDYLRIDGAWRDHVLTARVNPEWTA